MEDLGVVVSILYQFGTNGAFLLLCALGLIVILGMMNIINLAHGELMMMGAYTASLAYQAGLPFPLAVVVSFFLVGAFGALLERLVVRRFYGRELGALVVTWGISLLLSQGTFLVLGPFLPSIPIPGGAIDVGQYSLSVYWLILIVVSAAAVLGLAWLYNRTEFGLHGPRHHAKRGDGARARRQHRPRLHADLQPRRGSLRIQRRAPCPQPPRSCPSWASSSWPPPSSPWWSAARPT